MKFEAPFAMFIQ